MNEDYLVPGEEFHIFSCLDLLSIYSTYLEPYLGVQGSFMDKGLIEVAIMREVYYVLEEVVHPEDKTLTQTIEDIFVPTDIRDYFFTMFNMTLNRIIINIEAYLKGKILIEFDVRYGYVILAKTMVPRKLTMEPMTVYP